MMGLPWEPGRMGTGYEKLRLLEVISPFRFDLYLLRYGKGAGIPLHVDPSPIAGLRHFRVNFTIWRAARGGEVELFVCGSKPLRRAKPLFSIFRRRLYLFRPDMQPHCVRPVEEGVRYVLSLGWLA